MQSKTKPAISELTKNHERASSYSGKSWLHRLGAGLLAAIFLALIAFGVWGFTNRHKLAGVDPNKYQAVFLTNGQVYFGRVSRASRDTVRITDIYYLQVQQSVQGQDSKDADSKPKADTSLIKLGSELHGPDDAMYVPKSQILFWENLKGDGKVVDAIKNYQKK